MYSFVNFKKGFIFYLTFKLVLVQNITLISIPGIPLLTLDMFMALSYIILFVIRNRTSRTGLSKPVMIFPYRVPFSFIVLSLLVSSVFSIAGFMTELSGLIGNIVQNIIIVWLMWQLIETKEDFILLFKFFTIIFFFSCIYGFIEFFIQSNPIVSYEATLNKDASRVINWSYSTTFRGYRVQSFFEHAIGAGINWAMYAVFVLILFVNNPFRVSIHKFVLITALLCVPCIILTKMRGPILFFLIAILSIVDFSKKSFYRVLLMVIVLGILLWPLVQDNANIFLSFFDSSAQDKIAGSSLSQRENQFNAAFELLKISPVCGLGAKYANVLSNRYVHDLLGGESIWLTIIVNYGILGLISNIVLAFYSIFLLPKKFNSKPMVFFAVTYWVTNSFTSVPGMHMFMYYLIMIYFMKTSRRYQSNKKSKR